MAVKEVICGVSKWARTFPTGGLEELQPDQLQRLGSGHLPQLGRKEEGGIKALAQSSRH